MRLRHIEVFHAVMQAGTISGAAQVLHISQPAVTKVLQHCELQLGLPLFERDAARSVHAGPQRNLAMVVTRGARHGFDERHGLVERIRATALHVAEEVILFAAVGSRRDDGAGTTIELTEFLVEGFAQFINGQAGGHDIFRLQERDASVWADRYVDFGGVPLRCKEQNLCSGL